VVSAEDNGRANPRELPRQLVGVCALLVAIGAVAFIGGLMGDHPETAWRAFHVNFVYFTTLALGGLMVSCCLVIVGAGWAGPVRHVAEGLAAWVPVSLVLLIVQYFGRNEIHTNWIHGAPAGKEVWLNVGRVYLTDLGLMFVLSWLTLAYLRASFRPALHGAAERAPRFKGLFARWTRDWRGDAEERAASYRKLRTLAPICALVYAFGYTLFAYDQVMSLDPMWFSNMFGWYFNWAGLLNGVAATALICVLLSRGPAWDAVITRARMHDLGKMLFAFSIFWMYLFFAQYIVIWYGNLPEETQYIQARLGTQFMQDTWHWAWTNLDQPYVKLSLTAWFGCWVIPFWVLLGQAPKQTKSILGGVALVSLLGFWLERNALVWPSLVPDDGMAWFGPVQLGVALGFVGAFSLVYLVFSRVFPTLPLPESS
jgi:hypothetical protein